MRGLSDLILVVEHESLLLLGSEAEAGVEVVPECGNTCQSQVQVALPGEMSLTSHLNEHTHTHSRLTQTIIARDFRETHEKVL